MQKAIQESSKLDLHTTKQALASWHKSLRSSGLAPLDAAKIAIEALLLRDGDSGVNVPGTSLTIAGSEIGKLVELIYQEFFIAEARSGFGQYLTPQPVADFIADIINKHLQPTDSVLDPFCGSGILLKAVNAANPQVRLHGIEIHQDLSTIIETIADITGISLHLRCADAFDLWINDDIAEMDCVVTNPPFGALVTKANLEDLTKWTTPLAKLKNIPAELLGMELMLDVLKPNGRFAIVLPQSVLNNVSWNAYRLHFMKKALIDAVVYLPEATFVPFKGVARSCVLFGHKHIRNEMSTDRLPLYISQSVGYTSSGRTEETSDLDVVASKISQSSLPDGYLTLSPDGRLDSEDTTYLDDSDSVVIGDFADVFTGKTFPHSEYEPQGAFVLKVGDLQHSFISWNERERSYISLNRYDNLVKIHLKQGDICLTASAHRSKYIAQKVNIIYELPIQGAIPSAEVMVIRIRDGWEIKPETLLLYLKKGGGSQRMQRLVRGSTSHLYRKDVLKMRVPRDLLQADNNHQARSLYRRAAIAHREATQLEGLAYKSTVAESVIITDSQ